MSGSNLLEAEILGVPTLVLGQPEFSQVCRFRGLSDFPQFINFCSAQNTLQSSDELVRYLALIHARSAPDDLREGVELSDDEITRYCKQLIKRINRNLAFNTELPFTVTN